MKAGRAPLSILLGLFLALLVIGGLLWINGAPGGPEPQSTPATTTRTPPQSTPATTTRTPAPSAPATAEPQAPAALDSVRESALPVQAQTTLALIRKGGPYPYRQDGVVFSNRERILPRQGRDYYREYTVRTPGAGDRGPRRIVVGENGKFYTDDHYASFRFILEGR